MRKTHELEKSEKCESLLKKVIKEEEWDAWKRELVNYFKMIKGETKS